MDCALKHQRRSLSPLTYCVLLERHTREALHDKVVIIQIRINNTQFANDTTLPVENITNL